MNKFVDLVQNIVKRYFARFEKFRDGVATPGQGEPSSPTENLLSMPSRKVFVGEEDMYSGKLMEELMQMVARAEEHANEIMAEREQPEAYVFHASRPAYDATTQPALMGAA